MLNTALRRVLELSKLTFKKLIKLCYTCFYNIEMTNEDVYIDGEY